MTRRRQIGRRLADNGILDDEVRRRAARRRAYGGGHGAAEHEAQRDDRAGDAVLGLLGCGGLREQAELFLVDRGQFPAVRVGDMMSRPDASRRRRRDETASTRPKLTDRVAEASTR